MLMLRYPVMIILYLLRQMRIDIRVYNDTSQQSISIIDPKYHKIFAAVRISVFRDYAIVSVKTYIHYIAT